MATKTKHTQELAHDTTFVVPDNGTAAMEVAEKLYDQFFLESDPTKKRETMKNYNNCVVFVNKDAGRKLLVALSMKTPAPKAEEEIVAPAPVSMDNFIGNDDGATAAGDAKLVVKSKPVRHLDTKGKDKQKPKAQPKAKPVVAAKPAPAAKSKTAKPKSTNTVVVREKGEPKAGTKTAQILDHHRAGKSNKEIIDMGFTPSVVSWQISLYKKRVEAKLKTKK